MPDGGREQGHGRDIAHAVAGEVERQRPGASAARAPAGCPARGRCPRARAGSRRRTTCGAWSCGASCVRPGQARERSRCDVHVDVRVRTVAMRVHVLVDFQSRRPTNAPEADRNQGDADEALAPGRQRLERQHLPEQQGGDADGDHATGVAEPPRESCRATANGGCRPRAARRPPGGRARRGRGPPPAARPASTMASISGGPRPARAARSGRQWRIAGPPARRRMQVAAPAAGHVVAHGHAWRIHHRLFAIAADVEGPDRRDVEDLVSPVLQRRAVELQHLLVRRRRAVTGSSAVPGPRRTSRGTSRWVDRRAERGFGWWGLCWLRCGRAAAAAAGEPGPAQWPAPEAAGAGTAGPGFVAAGATRLGADPTAPAQPCPWRARR